MTLPSSNPRKTRRELMPLFKNCMPRIWCCIKLPMEEKKDTIFILIPL